MPSTSTAEPVVEKPALDVLRAQRELQRILAAAHAVDSDRWS